MTWPQRLWQDLQPGPGRLAAALRIVLATVIALVLMMVLQMPSASLGLYFIFLIARDSPEMSVKSGVVSMFTLSLAVAVSLAVVIVSDNDPFIRLMSVAAVAYLSGTIMAAGSLPALGGIFGLIYCTVIALWERPAPADTLVKASLFILGTVSLAFLCAIVVEYLFAFRHPADRLTDQIRQRYNTIASVYALFAQGAPAAQLGPAIVGLNRLAGTGQGPMQALYGSIRDLSNVTASRVQITLLAQLMDTAAAFASHYPAGVSEELRARCADIARRCRERIPCSMDIELPEHPALLDRVERALDMALAAPDDKEARDHPVPPASAKPPFFIPGALTSRDTVGFALKVTLCVMLCYIFYWAVAWPGISTAVTTVFLTALGNTGAIKQKMFNRVVGSAIGGALAIFATAFLFPEMDTIASLVLLIGAVAFISAWWGGGRQFGYAGVQIAFSFYLVAFEGFSAPTELAPPRDRLAGIFIALVLIWIVFDQLWPVRTVTAMRRAFASVMRGEARLLRLFQSGADYRTRLQQVEGLRDQIGKTIAGLRTMNDAVVYEFGLDRQEQTQSSEAILQAALTEVPFFWNQLAVLHHQADADFLSESGLIEMRTRIAAHLDAMADAVVREKPFAPAYAAWLVDPALLTSPRFGEYARNTVAAHEELQLKVTKLPVA